MTLHDRRVKISMDGKGRYSGNIVVERLWRTVKYEEVYLKVYASMVGPVGFSLNSALVLSK